MKVPFVSFKPMEKELDAELRSAFDRVYNRSWYIEGEEDEKILLHTVGYSIALVVAMD